ncbi:MAG: porphobilinogen synthase [Hellea sp.]|nr:porphobilinogen synthase [Hellea sp.]MDG1666222.1 porphobilinogen synthase [Hellea sp.]
MSTYPFTRLRRTRVSGWSRRMVSENVIMRDDLIWTIIITDAKEKRTSIPSMPGVDRVNLDEVVSEAKKARDLGIPAIALFPHINPKYKSDCASEALNPNGLIPQAVSAIKSAVPDLGIIVDVALDPYTIHGHDGLLEGNKILNDASVEILAQSAVILGNAGADIVAPSDMMDGRVASIRESLERAQLNDVMIMSYAAKYASSFYGPYRDAIGTSSSLIGDKRTYQMDPANSDEALREVEQDIIEGADMIMIKPGMPYLDIIKRIKDEFRMPTYAFQVSGEYSMLKAVSQNGWLDEKKIVLESLTSFKRAGCDGILTYFAPQVADWLSH